MRSNRWSFKVLRCAILVVSCGMTNWKTCVSAEPLVNCSAPWDFRSGDNWTIAEPQFFMSGPNSVTLVYALDAMMDESDVDVRLFSSSECYEGTLRGTSVDILQDQENDEEEYLTYNLSKSSSTSSSSTNTVDWEVEVTYVADMITTSPLFRNVDGDDVGEVLFCLRLSLLDDESEEQNCLENVVEISVDVTNSFLIDSVQVENKQGLHPDSDYKVETFECDDSLQPMDDTAAHVVTRGGAAEVRICVTPNQEAIESGVVMQSIDSFRFARLGDDQIIQQDVIDQGGSLVDDGLSEIYCDAGSVLCFVDVYLKSAFFQSEGTLEGIGSAILMFQTDLDVVEDPTSAPAPTGSSGGGSSPTGSSGGGSSPTGSSGGSSPTAAAVSSCEDDYKDSVQVKSGKPFQYPEPIGHPFVEIAHYTGSSALGDRKVQIKVTNVFGGEIDGWFLEKEDCEYKPDIADGATSFWTLDCQDAVDDLITMMLVVENPRFPNVDKYTPPDPDYCSLYGVRPGIHTRMYELTIPCACDEVPIFVVDEDIDSHPGCPSDYTQAIRVTNESVGYDPPYQNFAQITHYNGPADSRSVTFETEQVFKQGSITGWYLLADPCEYIPGVEFGVKSQWTIDCQVDDHQFATILLAVESSSFLETDTVDLPSADFCSDYGPRPGTRTRVYRLDIPCNCESVPIENGGGEPTAPIGAQPTAPTGQSPTAPTGQPPTPLPPSSTVEGEVISSSCQSSILSNHEIPIPNPVIVEEYIGNYARITIRQSFSVNTILDWYLTNGDFCDRIQNVPYSASKSYLVNCHPTSNVDESNLNLMLTDTSFEGDIADFSMPCQVLYGGGIYRTNSRLYQIHVPCDCPVGGRRRNRELQMMVGKTPIAVQIDVRAPDQLELEEWGSMDDVLVESNSNHHPLRVLIVFLGMVGGAFIGVHVYKRIREGKYGARTDTQELPNGGMLRNFS